MNILETNKAQISEQNGEKHTIHIVGNILCVASFFGLSKDPKYYTDKTFWPMFFFIYHKEPLKKYQHHCYLLRPLEGSSRHLR